MARCPDCNKFVSYEDPPQTETYSEPEVSSSNCVEGAVRVVLLCGECGTELKDAEVEFSVTIDHKCEWEDVLDKMNAAGKAKVDADGEYTDAQREAAKAEANKPYEDDQFSVEDSSFDGDSRVQDTMLVRRGRGENRKLVRVRVPARYQKTFYGFTGTVTLACDRCGQTFDMEVSGDEQASSFNELT